MNRQERRRRAGKKGRTASEPRRLEIPRSPSGAIPAALRLPPGVSGRPVVRLGDGDELGFCMDPDRTDDCFRAAIATATQVPVEKVPDLRLDERVGAGEDPEQISRDSWERIARWALGHGLQLVFHDTVPVDRRRWVGICAPCSDEQDAVRARAVRGFERRRRQGDNPFSHHCLVMEFDRIVFDPAISVRVPAGMRMRAWRPSDVAHGVSFDRKD